MKILNELVDLEYALKKIEELLGSSHQREPYKRFTILAYQLANVGRSIRYMRIFPADETAYRASLKTDLSDLLIQTLTMIRLYGFSLDEMLKLGAERVEEFQERVGFKDD